jgi:ribosomal protein S19E (S16A)
MIEAARVYLRGVGKPSTPYKNYVDLFEAVSEKERSMIVGLEEFDSKDYVQGFIEALNRDKELNSNQRDFWSERIAEILRNLGLENESKQLSEAY